MAGAPPIITETSRPWWDALGHGEIAMQRCDSCASWVFYPRNFCPSCSSRDLTWSPVSGNATLYTFSVAETPVAKAFAHLDRPVLAVVELANGVRVPSRLVDVAPEDVRIGMALEPVFDAESYEGVTMLLFRPAA